MPCEMQLQGQIAAIRTRGMMRRAPMAASPAGQLGPPMSGAEEERFLRVLRGDRFVPPAKENDSQPAPETLTPALDDLKQELSVEAQRIFGSTDIVVSDLRFQRGTLEIVALVTATATIVKEFGSIAQGLRELSRLVPARLRTFLTQGATQVFGQAAEMHMEGDPAIEARGGLLGAIEVQRDSTAAAPTLTGAGAAGRAQPEGGPAANELASSSSASSVPISGGGSVRTDARLVTYLLASHAVLTLAVIAAVAVLLVELS